MPAFIETARSRFSDNRKAAARLILSDATLGNRTEPALELRDEGRVAV